MKWPHPIFWEDYAAMFMFAGGAFFFGLPLWICPVIGVIAWLVIAQ